MIAIVLALALLAGAELAQAARGGGGRGGGMGGGHASGPITGRPPQFAGRPIHFTGGPTHFTGVRPIVGVRPAPVFAGRPPFFPHNRVVVGTTVVVGAPFYWYPPYPYPYYPYPAYPAYTEEPAYVEQGVDVRYYCPDYRDYYPTVQTCPSPWLQVVPGAAGY
jgi:hypothetical protein